MLFFDNQTEHHIDKDIFEKLASAITERDVELIVCDDDSIAELNMEHRGIGSATDVLSFPIDSDLAHIPIGTIVISCDHAAKEAKELGHMFNDELSLLFIHGLLHLLGYDHESDDGEMRSMEHELINRFELPESLIVRTGKE